MEMINSRRSSQAKEVNHDLLSGLLDASESDFDEYSKLTDRELLGKLTQPSSYIRMCSIQCFRQRLYFPYCR